MSSQGISDNSWRCRLGNLVGGFTDDLDVLDRGQRQFAVVLQILAATERANSAASLEASSMCCKRTLSSLRVLYFSLPQYLFAEIAAQVFRSAQIHLAPAQEGR